MKMIINENERGYLFKNGSFERFLEAGVYRFISFSDYKVKVVKLDSIVDTAGVDIKVLLRDEGFARSVAQINVPDNQLALHYIDGRIINILPSGEFYFWNIYRENTFELLDVSKPEVSATIDLNLFRYIPSKYYTKIEVSEGESALLYFDGRFDRALSSGVYYFWNCRTRVTHVIVDLRLQQLDITGQEILTTDKVTLRINFVCSYRVVDGVRLMSEIKDYKAQLYVLTQLALREYIGRFRFDELLEQKESIAGFVLNKLKERQADFYIEFTDAGIKDIILPGEIRDIMNTVLIAEKTAQANVISRREEVASTRSLLNTAKLMEENQTLYKLKELEYLERICDKVGNISIAGGNNLLTQLNELLCQK